MTAPEASTSALPSRPPTPKHKKLGGYDFYRSIGSPKYIVAPMVDQSELAWRLLSKAPLPASFADKPEYVEGDTGNHYARYTGGAHLSYTPMIHARVFVESKGNTNRTDPQFNLTIDEEGSSDPLAGIEGGDRPLIVQFCANDADVLLEATKKVEHRCDAVDINFGCPQGIAKRGHYGSFLMEDWPLVSKLISTLHENLSIPVTAKFRIFPDVRKTIEYAQMMEASGAQILTCHGRTREMKGQATGMADWDQIKAVKAAVSVPVFANGNILYRDDVDRCLEYTGCDGVMSAEGNLSNPALFMPTDNKHAFVNAIILAERYLDIVDALKTPTAGSAVKAHMFRLLKPVLDDHEDLRIAVASCSSEPDRRSERYREILARITERVGNPAPSVPAPPLEPTGYRTLPAWAAQPYIRPSPVSAKVPGHPEYEDGTPVPVPGTNELELCAGHECPMISATRCPMRACILHCRELRAVEGGMDPQKAKEEAARGGLIGYGCETHEAKVAARQKRKREKNERVKAAKQRKRVRRKENAKSRSRSASPEPSGAATPGEAVAEA